MLYEESGTIDFLPHVQMYMVIAESVAQVSSCEFRIINTFKTLLDSYGTQPDRWIRMFNKFQTCIETKFYNNCLNCIFFAIVFLNN